MGADGGSIPRRDELVKHKKKTEQKDKNTESVNKWKYCALSSEKLRQPIVSCPLGKLYNKQAIIEFLLNKDEFKNNTTVSHIRSLKDIKELKLTKQKSNEKTNDEQCSESIYICPIVGLEMNGNYRFFYSKNCGCVISERALKEVKSEVCLKCNEPFVSTDLIPINGTNEEINNLRIKLETSRNQSKDGKKKRKSSDDKELFNSKNKVHKSIVAKTSATLLLPEKAKDVYSIANDPNVSETYKSLFTTHKTAKNQMKNNWVSFNPMYYR